VLKSSAVYRRNLPHIQKPDTPHFVTFRCVNQSTLTPELRDIVYHHCLFDHEKRIRMHAFTVMPNHVHLLFTPLRDPEGNHYPLATIMSGIKGSSAHRINKHLARRGTVWQDESFDHILRHEESFDDKVLYILNNPVRAGIVNHWQEYRWSWVELLGTAEGGCAT
jgi:REP element-mobilizing transposase RayT